MTLFSHVTQLMYLVNESTHLTQSMYSVKVFLLFSFTLLRCFAQTLYSVNKVSHFTQSMYSVILLSHFPQSFSFSFVVLFLYNSNLSCNSYQKQSIKLDLLPSTCSSHLPWFLELIIFLAYTPGTRLLMQIKVTGGDGDWGNIPPGRGFRGCRKRMNPRKKPL